ncbi:hypothetical protein BG006_000772 [Podila minutissima]|uniref:C2H2-type domain-containing protein n=1 Tax=Podila minutissima TaxID=64525 RepID=A0A9P5SBI9_9FUNG|nr:hypothetical protein BG006_000772 [Podila minutissima]
MESIPSPHSFIFSDDYICQWDSCFKNFDDAEALYEHLRDEHVGRKAQHNLCLTCKWGKCTVGTFGKRDHITSHLRVHVSSKPYTCEVCNKGFKRPQDLKKHEKTHQDYKDVESLEPSNSAPSTANNKFLQPKPDALYQPLTPPTVLDRSPSVSSSALGSSLSPYSDPLSPASIPDTIDSSWNPGLSASPSYSGSDMYSSPNAPDLELDMMAPFGRPGGVDVSGAYYGAFPTPDTYEDLTSPMSSKRSRDGFDEILSDTLGAFALESKKKRLDSTYNEDMMGRLNALSAILEVSPLTPDHLVSALPDVSDWNQFNQFNQFCSTLFEDVSGEAFEPQTFDMPLFQDFDQKQLLDGSVPLISDGLSSFNSNLGDSIFKTLIPDDTLSSSSLGGYGDMSWDGTSDISPSNGVRRVKPAKPTQQLNNPFKQQYVSMPSLRNANPDAAVKVEPTEEVFEPTVAVKNVRRYIDMSTQTGGNGCKRVVSSDGTMAMVRPTEKKTDKCETVHPTILLTAIPAVLSTPTPEIVQGTQGQSDMEEVSEDVNDIPTETSTESQTLASKYNSILRKHRNRHTASAPPPPVQEPLDPVEAITRQLAQSNLESTHKLPVKASTTKPIMEGDMERQMRAAEARSMCSQDPVRKQHAEVVLNLLKSIDTLMIEHRQKVAQWKQAQTKGASGPRAGASGRQVMYPRTHVNSRQQEPIRTVSSYLHRSTAHQPSPLQQEQAWEPSYKVHSHEGTTTPGKASSGSTDSPVLYPTSDLHRSVVVPFELSEEERRFIEEDNAKTAAAQAQAQGMAV